MAYEAQIAHKSIKGNGFANEPLVFIAGPGAPHGEQVIGQAIKQGAKGIVSLGICGGLDPQLFSGHIVIPKEILQNDDKPITYQNTQVDLAWRAALLPVIEKDYFVTSSPLLTVTDPVTSITDKRKLHEQTGACAVDMESGKIAALAKAHGLPFIAVRVVGDVAGQSIPAAFDKVLKPNGELSVFELIKGLVTKWPGLQALKGLAKNDGEARANLSGLTTLALPNFKLPE